MHITRIQLRHSFILLIRPFQLPYKFELPDSRSFRKTQQETAYYELSKDPSGLSCLYSPCGLVGNEFLGGRGSRSRCGRTPYLAWHCSGITAVEIEQGTGMSGRKSIVEPTLFALRSGHAARTAASEDDQALSVKAFRGSRRHDRQRLAANLGLCPCLHQATEPVKRL